MNAVSHDLSPGPQPLDPSTPLAQRVDEACDRFEAAWMRGEPPRIEDFLTELKDAECAAFLRELLTIDLAYRRGHGEQPTPREYLARFPGHEAIIREVVGEVAGSPKPGRSGDTPSTGKDGDSSGALPAGRAQLSLTVTQGPHAGQEFTLNGHDSFVVGRGKCAHFKLPLKDRYFSRFHFIIEFNPPFCRLLDLGSTNHTFLNGKRVMKAELKDGDIIGGGKTRIRVAIREVPDSEPAMITETYLGPEGQTLAPLLAPEERSGPEPLTDSLPPTATLVPAPGVSPSVCVACGGAAEPTGGGPEAGTAGLPQARLCPLCHGKLQAGSHPIEGYGLVRELGRGGMGIVYLAVRLSDGALVALKTIHRASAASGRDIARFLREAKILREIDHARIVRFLDIAESRGRLYYAMEYIPGLDAGRLLKRSVAPLATGRAVGWVCQALEALGYTHTRRFVHRDIKPSNLLVFGPPGQETVKLADFGLARVYEASRISGLTLSSDIAGTMEFLPPEQITSFRDARPPADLYGIGATLYYLLTRKHVYDFPDRLELKILKILQDDPIPIHDRRSDLPEGLVAVIARSLSREPSDRFPDARAMREALEPFRSSDFPPVGTS
jgi:serine/threonine-protein kinase